MSFTSELMDGLAQYLENEGVGVFHSSGVGYTAAQVGIVHAVVPASPDRVVVLTPYAAADAPTLSDSQVSLQVRVRGTRDPRVAYDLDDRAFDAMQNLPRRVIGGATVAGAWRTSGAYLGIDANGRHEVVSNYRLHVNRPSPHRD